MIFKNNNGDIYEEVENISEPNQYKIQNREYGIIEFHSSQAGKTTHTSYNAVGKIMYSADRIFTNTSATGEILETMGGVFRNNEKIMKDVKTIGDAAVVIQQTQANIDTLKNIDLNYQITEAKGLKVDLVGGIQDGEVVSNNLKSDNSTAVNTLTTLNRWVESHKDISDLDNRVKEANLQLAELERGKSDKSTVKSIGDDIQLFKQGVAINNLQVSKDISNLTMKDTTFQNSLKTLDKSKAGSESVTSANGYLLIPDTLQLTTGYLNKVRLNNNGMVSINVNIASRDGGNSIIDGTKVATLYPGFKPSSTIIIPVIVGRDNGYYSGGGYAVINKNGEISVTSFESKPFKNVYLTNINFETQRFGNLYVNKNIATFGDSVTWYDSQQYYDNHVEHGKVCVGYQSYLLQDTGMNLFNEGVSGATSLNMVSKIKSYLNFSQIDFISLTVGANDHRLGTPIGNIMAKGSNFNEKTFYGALQKSIEHIKITKPTIKIFMMTPTKCFYDVNNSVTNPNIGNNGNVLNVKFINAIKEIATLYNIPLLNWYDDIDITWENRHEYFGDKESIGYWIHPKMNLYGLMGIGYSKFILDNMNK